MDVKFLVFVDPLLELAEVQGLYLLLIGFWAYPYEEHLVAHARARDGLLLAQIRLRLRRELDRWMPLVGSRCAGLVACGQVLLDGNNPVLSAYECWLRFY